MSDIILLHYLSILNISRHFDFLRSSYGVGWVSLVVDVIVIVIDVGGGTVGGVAVKYQRKRVVGIVYYGDLEHGRAATGLGRMLRLLLLHDNVSFVGDFARQTILYPRVALHEPACAHSDASECQVCSIDSKNK